MKQRIRNFWFGLSIEHRVLIAIGSLVIGLVILCSLIYGTVNFFADRKYENGIDQTNENQHKVNSNSHETNANSIQLDIELTNSRLKSTLAAREQSDQRAAASKIKTQQKVKRYEEIKKSTPRIRNSDDFISDDELRSNAAKAGVPFDEQPD